jgi:hypothetical protein
VVEAKNRGPAADVENRTVSPTSAFGLAITRGLASLGA